MKKYINLNDNSVWTIEELRALYLDAQANNMYLDESFKSFINDLIESGDFQELD